MDPFRDVSGSDFTGGCPAAPASCLPFMRMSWMAFPYSTQIPIMRIASVPKPPSLRGRPRTAIVHQSEPYSRCRRQAASDKEADSVALIRKRRSASHLNRRSVFPIYPSSTGYQASQSDRHSLVAEVMLIGTGAFFCGFETIGSSFSGRCISRKRYCKPAF